MSELNEFSDLKIRHSHSMDNSFLEDDTLTISQKLEFSRDYTPAYKGSLEMIIGPMFAGKSTELLRRV
jgi:hypothetical protein